MDAILKFLPNRVRRLYLGGSGIDRMRGETNPADGYYPEDWIASCIEGNTREFQAPGHGLSKVRIDGEEVRFLDLLEKISIDRDGCGFRSLFNDLSYMLMNSFTGFPVFLREQGRCIHGFQASYNFRRDHAVSPPLLVDGAFFAPPAISRQPPRLHASSFHNRRSYTRASRWT